MCLVTPVVSFHPNDEIEIGFCLKDWSISYCLGLFRDKAEASLRGPAGAGQRGNEHGTPEDLSLRDGGHPGENHRTAHARMLVHARTNC
jgi:hypothetical protein